MVKFDDSGTIEWQTPFGGSAEDYIYSIEQTSDSGFIVCGGTNSQDGVLTNGTGNQRVWIVKFGEVQSIEELTTEKRLIKVVDLLGREVQPEPNKVLIYIYSDGTSEKVFKLE